ncbi:Fungal peroxidase [Mycena kentingensis (nom. inval.)]|nr:Fungal peroxidase [Mycena kentingensis (nom. inval.)]
MKTPSFYTLFGLGLCAQIAAAIGVEDSSSLERRADDILIDPAAIPSLPSLDKASAAAASNGLNLSNIQGDLLIGMRKNKEQFVFFSISNPLIFKKQFKKNVLPLITTTTQILNPPRRPKASLNIAFSSRGLVKLGIADNLNDTAFTAGMRNQAELGLLGDPLPLTDPGRWKPEFSGSTIDGVLIIASDTDTNMGGCRDAISKLFANCAKQVYSLSGAARPGNQAGHEHFGYADGISNPAIQGFDTASKGQPPFPGQAVVPPGEILLGNTGDRNTRPDWTKDGSFLAFRQLKQLVPEFNQFVNANPLPVKGLTKQQQSDLFGARMVGRWKSGAPVFLSPRVDNATLGADPMLNNDFNYALNGAAQADPTDQSRCPFSAHIRKTRPRADLNGSDPNSNHHIVRAGIPYGPEVTAAEARTSKSTKDRGLAFVSYQSNLLAGFQFIQRIWANNPNFVHPGTGFDPIIGANSSQPRQVKGLDLTNPNRTVTITTDFVVSEGGEYFFSPSMAALSSSRFSA